MDKLTEKTEIKGFSSNKKKGAYGKISPFFNFSSEYGLSEKGRLAVDLILFTVGFLFTRAHLFFGAHPVGLALVGVLPLGIWSALLGCVIGALSMGINGIVFAAGAVIVVFLRAAISCADKDCHGGSGMFKEALLLRMSAAIIGGFIAALYEALLSGLDERSLIFGLSMIILPPVITFIFSGMFYEEISLNSLIQGGRDIFSLSGKNEKEKYNLIFFQLSSLTLIFLISLSFKAVTIMGISISYVFSGVITLMVAKRFGALRGFATGFISALGVSADYSAAFALCGFGAGLTFGLGTGYAIITGGVALIGFGIYSSGMGGLLSLLPEYSLSTAIALPFLKKISEIKPHIEEKELGSSAEDMVGTMALAYQNRFSGSLDSLEIALQTLSTIIKSYCAPPTSLSENEYKEIVLSVAEEMCSQCAENQLCRKEDIKPCVENARNIASVLAMGRQVIPEDINTDREFCKQTSEVADRINRRAAIKEQERFAIQDNGGVAEEYHMISRLINTARSRDDAERAVDNSLTSTLTEILEKQGISGGTIRVFGERRRHFILAGEDEDGSKITSGELRENIERALALRLDTPEYFRSGKMLLMECGIRRRLSVSIATACAPGDESEISGDSVIGFESGDDFFYSLLSDGMGRGELAHETSSFVVDFMKCALETGAAKDTLIYMMNHALRARQKECSATVDLFELDLLTAEATFIKSGAACSYVKRDSSIFRIRSQTAPIGVLKTIDTEKIRVEIRPGDYVIMLSDGVSDPSEDSPWLLLMLGEEPKGSLKEYAEDILMRAKQNREATDDMSVIVMKINAL